MLDPKLIRGQLEDTAQRLAARGFKLDSARIAALEAERKEVQVRTQALQSERNTQSKAIGKAKATGADTAALMAAVAQLGDQLKQAEARLAALQDELNEILLGVPNVPHSSVPMGKDENDNVEVRRWGTPSSISLSSSCSAASRASACLSWSPSCATAVISAAVSAPAALALPMAFDWVLRSRCSA